MLVAELIRRKRDGLELAAAEIGDLVDCSDAGLAGPVLDNTRRVWPLHHLRHHGVSTGVYRRR
ncbi:MAG: hypothetical protein ABSG43_20835 [Solirubrobacteraceae bacterium]